MKNLQKTLQRHEKITLKLVNQFINWFYADDEESQETEKETLERFVCAGRDYDIFELADMHLNISDVCECIKCGATADQFIEWYWSYEYNEDSTDFSRKYNLKNFLKLEKKDG